MDSPVRIQLKKNDYLRHKFFRTLNRRKKRLLLQLIEAPEKELRRRLRLKRYEGGKNPMDYEYRGTVYDDELKNQGITHVAELPEVVVKGRDYTKPYESAFEYDPNFAKELPYFLPVVGDALDAVDVARDVYNGDYLSAGIGAVMLALPNFIEKPLKGVGKIIRRAADAKKAQSIIDANKISKWTPEQWTAAQDAAIARGDMAEALMLRDLHQSLTPTATPGKYYRGTETKRSSYPDRHIDEEIGEMNGIYLTKTPKYARTYGDVEEFYLRSNNPLETEGSWTGVIDDATRAEIENMGYDAVVNNKFDTGFLNKLLRNSRDETITFDGRNLKLADAVTYDDNGVRIPLGERDNFNLNDIRYGLLPFGIGLAAYGTTNSNSGTTVYSKGKDSGIHIKPENRGKFNALKKRTGKTTEELTHSKNPLTRKRAIFALNARKWNHKK